MLYKKLFALFLCLTFLNQIFSQTAAKVEVKRNVVAPELQEKAADLLKALARDAEQFSLPFNRVTARIQIAELLWQSDEKQSRAIFQNASIELNSIINQIPTENAEDENENVERYQILNDAKTLRSDLLVALAARDPKVALETLQTLSRRDETGKSLFDDDQTLELNLAAQIAARDPKQSYEMAKKNLENGISNSLFSTLESLYGKDQELGAKLAKEIAAKIKTKNSEIGTLNNLPGNRIVETGAMSNVAINSAQNSMFSVNTWDVQAFLETIKKLNRQAAKNKKPDVLAENEIREVVGILAQKYVRQQYLSAYEVTKAMPEIIKYFPSQAQIIQRKIGQEQSAILGNLIGAENFQNEIEDKSTDEIAQIIERKPPAERDNLYYKSAEIAFGKGEIEDAKKFHDKIKTRREDDYLSNTIAEAMPLALAEKGDSKELRQMLGKLKTPEERIELLTTMAIGVGEKGDQKTAAALASEARATYSGKMKSRKNLASVLQIAQAYAALDAEQSFNFLESNAAFFNDIIAAGILLDEFNEYGSVVKDEVRLDAAARESYRNLSKGVMLIKTLSAADFDRTVAFADKFSRAEVRFCARLRIADALLNPQAEADEKEFQTSVEGEGDID